MNALNIDIPNIDTNQVDNTKYIKQLADAMYQLQEQLKYTLSNISMDMFDSETYGIASKMSKLTGTIISDQLEVGDKTVIFPSVNMETMTSIEQTANAFTLLVTAESTRANTAESSLQTQITANAAGIAGKISATDAQTIATNTFNATATQWSATIRQDVIDQISGDIESECQSVFSQSASQIQSTVQQNVMDSISGSLTTMQSQITQNANNINLKVTSGDVESMINVAVGNISISASQIDLCGYTTVNNGFWIGVNGIAGANEMYIGTIKPPSSGGPTIATNLNCYGLSLNGVPVATVAILNELNEVYAPMTHLHTTADDIYGTPAKSSTNHMDLVKLANTTGSDMLATGAFVNTKVGNSSDRRLKKNIADVLFDDIKDKYMQLVPVTYEFRQNVGTQYIHYGFIAQDVADIFPEDEYDIVSVNNTDITDFQRAYCPTGIYELNNNNFHALTTKMVQWCVNELTTVTETVIELKAENELLRTQIEAMKVGEAE